MDEARRFPIVLLSSGLAAFVTHLGWGLLFGTKPSSDAAQYFVLGANIAGGHGYSLSPVPPHLPTDFRLPAYPVLLAVGRLAAHGIAGFVLVNSLLAAVSASALVWLAHLLYANHRREVMAGLLGVILPTSLAFVTSTLSENAAIPAVLVVLCLAVSTGSHSAATISSFAASAIFLAFTRPEGLAFSVAAAVLFGIRHKLRPLGVMALVGVVLLLPALWIARNRTEFGRTEYTDSAYPVAGLELSFNNGDVNDPLYSRGFMLADEPYDNAGRAAYRADVLHLASSRIRADALSVLTYKAKSLAYLPFPPPYYGAYATTGTTVGRIRSFSLRNSAYVAWLLVELLGYALAARTLLRWWRSGDRLLVFTMLFMPILLLLSACVFHAEQRTWVTMLPIVAVLAIGWEPSSSGLRPVAIPDDVDPSGVRDVAHT